LFVTCLVDLFRPNVGFATVKLLRDAGCRVEVPLAQTCCGQPAYNSGDFTTAAAIAKQVIAEFEGYDYVVAPSGSCAGMLNVHFPALFDTDLRWRARAEALAGRVFELMSFLVDVMGADRVATQYQGVFTYHDSCSGLRELGVREQPRALLRSVTGLRLEEMNDAEVCCGFGGTFCVKYPEISGRIVSEKTQCIAATGADTVLGGDLGCLLNIAGRLTREGSSVRVFHAAEVLAGAAGVPAIGAPRKA
jgi:L-lactate dehydrogenase complex protein LldE